MNIIRRLDEHKAIPDASVGHGSMCWPKATDANERLSASLVSLRIRSFSFLENLCTKTMVMEKRYNCMVHNNTRHVLPSTCGHVQKH